MTTVQDIFYNVAALLDEYTEDGAIVAGSDTIDMQEKTIRFTNMAQRELYKIGRNYKTFEFYQKPYDNLLGNQMNEVDYIGTIQTYGDVIGKCYYIEIFGSGTLKIQEMLNGSWTDLSVQNISTTKFESFKGVITTSQPSLQVRLLLDGTNVFKHRNRAIFEYPFSLTDIPSYQSSVQRAFPSDFGYLDKVVSEITNGGYNRASNYLIDGNQFIYVPYNVECSYKVYYRPIPTTITTINDTLQVDDITASAISYYVASKVAPYENKDLISFFENKYQELKQELKQSLNIQSEVMTNYYGGCL